MKMFCISANGAGDVFAILECEYEQTGKFGKITSPWKLFTKESGEVADYDLPQKRLTLDKEYQLMYPNKVRATAFSDIRMMGSDFPRLMKEWRVAVAPMIEAGDTLQIFTSVHWEKDLMGGGCAKVVKKKRLKLGK